MEHTKLIEFHNRSLEQRLAQLGQIKHNMQDKDLTAIPLNYGSISRY